MPKRTDDLPSMLSAVTEVLQEAAGPLSLQEIMDRVARRRPLEFANPKKTTRQALGQVELIQMTSDGHYAYVPNAISDASFRLPLAAADAKTARLRVGAEIIGALWPKRRYSADHSTATIEIPDGQTLRPGVKPVTSFTFELLFPPEFGDWIKAVRRDGSDFLVLRCRDGNLGAFALEGARSGKWEPTAIAVRSAEVLEMARSIFQHTEVVRIGTFVLRLLARGAYHGEPQPDSLARLLFGVDGRFAFGNGLDLTYRPGLTPGIRRLFADRLSEESLEPQLVEDAMVNPPSPFLASQTQRRQRKRPRPLAGENLCYRFKVALQWNRRVWRIIDVLGNQTLDDLHSAIQTAFGWDRDHLYSFFLSGKAWDHLTGIACPFEDSEPPTTDEVRIGELGIEPKQRFLYLFDYGDDLRHDVELLEVLPAAAEDRFPRIVEGHGEAPRQYGYSEEE